MRWLALIAVVFCLGSCSRVAYVIEGNQDLVLLTNLRADARGTISSLNQWRGTSVVPACTPVRITLVRPREIRFVATGTNRRYRYIMHRASRIPIEEHVNRYFGGQCTNTGQLAQADQAGLQQGRPMPGMTRTGVLLAVGYPPTHRTPDLNGPVWVYWGDAGEVTVQFNGDVVTNVTAAQPRGYTGPGRVIVR
jgi:hypothetical protein